MAIKDKIKEISTPKTAVIVPAPNPGPIYKAKFSILKNSSTFSICLKQR